MFTYVKKHGETKILILLCLISVVTGLIPAFLINLESRIIDAAVQGVKCLVGSDFVLFISAYAFLFLGIQLCDVISTYIQQLHNIRSGVRFETNRLEKANRVEFSLTETQAFHRMLEESSYISSIDSETWASFQSGLKNFCRFLSSFVVLLNMHALCAVVIMILIAVCTVIDAFVARSTGDLWSQYIENMRYPNYLAKLLLERDYADERKVFNYMPYMSNKYQKTYNRAMNENKALGRRRLYAEGGIAVIKAIYSIMIVLLLAKPLIVGEITIGVFGAAFTAAIALRDVGTQICDSAFTVMANEKKYEYYQEFMSLNESKKSFNNAINLPFTVIFDHVTFTYPGAMKPALEDVSFSFQSGQHVALVGENGCGKSTIVKLLCGLYKPDSGSITLNGNNVYDLSEESRRQFFAIMFQDFFHYPLSVRENLSLNANTTLSDQDVKELLLKVGVKSDDIERIIDANLLKGKGNSIDLSGGEWQKITSARVLLSRAPFVIMDEPNAAMDPQSEADFFGVCKEVLKDKTTLTISHRLGAVKDADAIIVLKSGEIIGFGRHKELLQNCAHYRSLYETQRGLYGKAM